MARTKNHPKKCKQCVFCNYWFGNAELKFISSTVGYEYEHYAEGKCAKQNSTKKAYLTCNAYAPSVEALKLF